MLLEEEQDNPVPYFDSQGHASIGIGVNLTVPGNMALVLQQLGVINASQTMVQQQRLVAQFEQVVTQSSPPTTSLNPLALQQALNTELQKITGFGADTFSLSQSFDAAFDLPLLGQSGRRVLSQLGPLGGFEQSLGRNSCRAASSNSANAYSRPVAVFRPQAAGDGNAAETVVQHLHAGTFETISSSANQPSLITKLRTRSEFVV